ncbi:efflux RND transporter periplasmic adaptor subunit [Virgisporangium aurantiacum]|uniref:RND transporter n=1 Tax=Virgisporangium aurantiacum TaxID=175570 RepID=A0A8J4DX92_9ACTN|nr:efflux RND transporter periplasmic adaptor subunit [Virgisporangium aurantiacum]GIJ53321.1 RND transporter [Virgisporangium aurantiacum]
MRVWLDSLRRPTVLVNVVLALVAVGGALWAVQTVRGPATAEAGTGSAQQRVIPVTQGDVTASVSASGNVQSASTATANFVTSGTVTEIAVKVGDVVTKGQVLAKVDTTLVQAQLDTARANRTAAGANYTRVKNAGGDAASLASASASVSSADAAVVSAQAAVDGTVLTAPIAGTVTAVNGAIGSSSGGSSSGSGSGSGSGTGATGSTTSSGFITLADLNSLQVSANFAEADATRLKVGQAATITWSALSGTRATGTVATVAPTATTQNNVNSYAVVVSIATPPAGVRLGQSTSVQVTVASASNAIRVSTLALRGTGTQRTVDVMVNGAVETRTVEIGVEGNQFAEVKSGLAVGDQVVVTMQSGSTTTNQQNGLFGGGGGLPAGGGAGPAGGGGGRGGN